MTKRVIITIYGVVQGVFFRESTKNKARELGLAGKVQNQADGSVYVDAEGEEEKLKELIDWCHQGPSGARVDKVDHEFVPDLKGYENFEVNF